METIFKRWWLLLLNGILFLILGVISLAYPVTALFSVAVYIGVVALVAGIGSIVVALSNMRVRSWGWRLLEGVIDVIFGLLMLGNPLLSAAMIPVLIGIWVFVRGLMYVADSLAWRRRGSGDWVALPDRGHPAAVLRVLAAAMCMGARRRAACSRWAWPAASAPVCWARASPWTGRPWPPLAWPWAGSRVSFWAR